MGHSDKGKYYCNTKCKQLDIKGEIDENKIIVLDFNVSFSVLDGLSSLIRVDSI